MSEEQGAAAAESRTDWSRAQIAALLDMPFADLLLEAAQVHRRNHRANEVQLCTLLSIKTGGCPEDCGYCSQSVHAATQALCFLAGANSIFIGEKLLTTANAGAGADAALFAKLGLSLLAGEEPMRPAGCAVDARRGGDEAIDVEPLQARA